jgi:thiamine pyrophosphate-dependent acetolactate synthase large subunit-like protein
MDRAPVLALTGQVNTQVLGPGAFQEIDISSAFEAVAAWSQTVLPGSKPAELMSLAVKHALVNRDVAHLILPNEVQVLPAPADAGPAGPEGRLSEVEITPARASLEKAAGLIAGARRPAIIAGHGARGSMDSIIPLAERLGAPVITTFKGKGLIGDDHPLATGVLGRSGTPVSSRCMTDSDLLMVFGASFAVHTGIDKNKPTIQVDYDRNALARFHPLTLPVWGEIGVTGKLLLEQLPREIAAEDQREKIARLWAQWRAEKDRRASRDQGRGMSSAAIFQHLASRIPEDAILAVDVGNNTYSFGRYFECKRQAVILSGYLGSIGFGFPAAIGAWAAHPGKPIVCICGDGGFGQYMAEFTTAVKYKMNITLFILNNQELGKISKEQRDENWEVWETSLHNPSFAKYAGNCGGLGIGINDAKDLPAAIREALEYQGPSLVEISSDPELI